MSKISMFGAAIALAAAAACSTQSGNPVAPATQAGGGTAGAAADGVTLKASAPANLLPANQTVTADRRPALSLENARGVYEQGPFQYRFELYEVNTLLLEAEVPQGGDGRTSYAVSQDLKQDTLYRWRARAELGGAVGPWSTTADFRTPAPPAPTTPTNPTPTNPTPGTGGGTVGPTRPIGLNEAFNIIVSYHNAIRADLGSGSSRDGRVAFLFSAVAIIHYGHPVFNPAGGDPGWCVKDAGGGRPPSDDVLVDCNTREAWDLIGGAGANGYTFHVDSLGRLPSEQNVYPPPRGSLPASAQ